MLIGAGSNANLMRRVADEAYFAYRERRLSERYGLTDEVFESSVGANPGNAEGPLAYQVLDPLTRQAAGPSVFDARRPHVD